MKVSVTANGKYTVEQVKETFTKLTLPIGLMWFTLLAVQTYTIWAQSYPRKHTNCITLVQERYFPKPLRHAEKSNCVEIGPTLPLQSSSLQPPKFNVDK